MTPRQDPCQESSSARQKRTAVIRRTPSPFSSYGLAQRSQLNPIIAGYASINSCVTDWIGSSSCLDRVLRRYNTAVDPDREKAVPAWRAAVSRKAKQAEQPRKGARAMLAGNTLQIHVPAHPAVHESNIGDRGSPGVKSQVAATAPPRPQEYNSAQIVLHAASAGAASTITMTGRTKQELLPLEQSVKSIRYALLTRQVPYARMCSPV